MFNPDDKTPLYLPMDIELIKALDDAFAKLNLPITQDVFVTTQKPGPELIPYPKKTITIRSDGGIYSGNGNIKNEYFGINIWTPTVQEAEELGPIVEAIFRRTTTEHIRKITISASPISAEYEGTEEQRYMTIYCSVAPINFSL